VAAKRKPSGPRRIRTKQGYRYIDAKGRRISADTYKTFKTLSNQAKAESSKKRGAVDHWKARRNAVKKNLGENVPRRPGPKADKHNRWMFDVVAQGDIPEPDSTAVRRNPLNPDETVTTRYWRFQGLEAQTFVKDFLHKLEDDNAIPGAGFQVNIGTGYGKQGEWIGSKFDTARNVSLWLDTWEQRPSGQRIMALVEDGSPIWFELTAETASKAKPRFTKQGRGNGKQKRSSKVGASKRAGKASRGKGKDKLRPSSKRAHSRGRPSGKRGKPSIVKGNRPTRRPKRRR
jgi:hypothetical protein